MITTDFKCRFCRDVFPSWSQNCPACLRLGALLRANVDTSTIQLVTKEDPHISELGEESTDDVERISTGFSNLDMVFGGGLAVGNVVQFGAAPGSGKTTILTQIAAMMGKKVLYITSEESKGRLARRARRVAGAAADSIRAVSTIDDKLGISEVCEAIKRSNAKIIIIDSLQGLRDGGARTSTGRKAKHTAFVVRDIALRLIEEANARKLTVLMTCHIAKDGALAGLKEIEHAVDVVAWFRGSTDSPLRQFTCTKNRDADTAVAAYFAMTDKGLVMQAAPHEDDDDERRGRRRTGRPRNGLAISTNNEDPFA